MVIKRNKKTMLLSPTDDTTSCKIIIKRITRNTITKDLSGGLFYCTTNEVHNFIMRFNKKTSQFKFFFFANDCGGYDYA